MTPALKLVSKTLQTIVKKEIEAISGRYSVYQILKSFKTATGSFIIFAKKRKIF